MRILSRVKTAPRADGARTCDERHAEHSVRRGNKKSSHVRGGLPTRFSSVAQALQVRVYVVHGRNRRYVRPPAGELERGVLPP